MARNGNGKHRLTDRQRAFVNEYLKDLNATQAYRRAGYTTNHADVAGPRLLGNVGVAAAIAKAQEARAKRTELSQDEVVGYLRTEARGEGPDTTASARVAASTALGKHLGMFIEKVETKDVSDRPKQVKLTVVQTKPDASSAASP